MSELLYVFAVTVRLALTVIYVSMLIHAILSWFIPGDQTFMVVLSVISAPVVFPVRAVLSRIPALERLPIDLSYLVAFFILVIVMNFLPPIF